MNPIKQNPQPHSPGYQEGHRVTNQPWSTIYGTEEDRIFFRDKKHITIEDLFMGIEFDCNGNIIFPF